MENIYFKPAEYERFEEMFSKTQEIIREQAEKLANAEITWVPLSKAAEIAGYHAKTLALDKEEIGYRTKGGKLFFKLSDLNNWLESTYRKPRRK